MALNRDLLARSWRSWYGHLAAPEGPRWLLWLWTTLFCLALAAAFALLAGALRAGPPADRAAWLRLYGQHAVVSLTIGYLIHALIDLGVAVIGAARMRRLTPGQRTAFFTLLPLGGVLIGWPLGMWLLGAELGRLREGAALASITLSLLISGVILIVFNAKARQAEAEKRAAEAQLRLLQAQMEPHFLFNTLANVLTLIETEPARARLMLESFTDYLRSSLGSLRRADGTVARELELAEAYLRLQHLRMADRLRFSIDADAAAHDCALPALLLQPLVENAVRHGLEPQITGGQIRIDVRVHGQHLLLSVADDGRGLDAAPPGRGPGGGNGMALDNIRRRLHALYGGAARLHLQATHPGTRATLELPLSKEPL